MPEELPPQTASDALMKAFEKAEDMEEVIIIWTTKGDKPQLDYEDNGLTISDAHYLVSSFLWHVMSSVFNKNQQGEHE